MTSAPGGVDSRRVELVGYDGGGPEVVRVVLGHGDEPDRLLALAGWRRRGLTAVDSSVRGSEQRVVVSFDVAPWGAAPVPDPAPVPRDAGLALGPDEAVLVVQRLGAYAVVVHHGSVLMTEFSDLTAASGTWGLPGGGVEPGEHPDDALRREVAEETGHRLTGARPMSLGAGHWVGRSPRGQVEDYHTIRLVYRAEVDAAREPVVHEVDSTTRSAAWVHMAALRDLPMTDIWRAMMAAAGLLVR